MPRGGWSATRVRNRLLQTELGADVKIFDDEHVDQLLRCLCEMALHTIHWRQMRPYLLAEDISIVPANPENEASPTHDLIIKGYLHGCALSTYDYVHITGEGTHCVRGIHVVPDPSPLKRSHNETPTDRLIEAEASRLKPVEEENAVDWSTVEAPHWQQPVVVRDGRGA